MGMTSVKDFLKTILFPALISLFLYVFLSYVIIPLYRRHRQRYAQYLPLETLSQHSSPLRARMSDAIARFLLPFTWLHGRRPGGQYGVGGVDRSLFDDEDGEGLVGLDVGPGRREHLERSIGVAHSDRRLSRDLEEGFQDESDGEEERPNDPRMNLPG